VELVRINITFTDAPDLSGRFFMTDIPRVGEHIRVALDATQERLVRVTEVEYYAAKSEELFNNRLRAFVKVETVDE
jgi:hypothetical protein